MGLDVSNLKTSKKLEEIRDSIPKENITIETLIEKLLEEGNYLLTIILIAPFLFPVSIPGSSTPFGLLIILLSISSLFDKPLYLPNFIKSYMLPSGTVDKFFDSLHKALNYVEIISKPRGRLTQNNKILNFNLLITIVLAFLLLLPLPIPFTDFIPAVAILLLSVSSMEKDSYLMILGYIATIGTICYFISVGYVGIEIIIMVLNTIGIHI